MLGTWYRDKLMGRARYDTVDVADISAAVFDNIIIVYLRVRIS